MRFFTPVLAATCLFAFGLSANAAIIVNDDFESYTSQANFQSTWAPLTATSATWSTTQSTSPTHSVEVAGTLNNNEQRNQRNFSETGSVTAGDQKIIWSFDFYDSAPTSSPNRTYANLQDGAANATNMLISMGLNNNQTGGNSGGQYYMARILGYTVPTGVGSDPDGGPDESVGGSGAYFKLNDFGAPHRSLGWHNLKVVLSTNDGLSTDYEFYVDGLLAERVSNVGTAASIRSFDHIRIGSGLSNGGQTAYFDNMYLAVVPEPSTVLLVGLGLVGWLVGGRRRNG